MKKENGITLVTLIVSIIVLLILATVSISLVINKGILDKAKSGVDKYSKEEILEQWKTALAEYEMSQFTEDTANIQARLEKIYGAGNVTDVIAENGILVAKINNAGEEKTYCFKSSKGNMEEVQLISEEESFIGYYADIDEDGNVDGIIFADLAFSKSGQWKNSNGAYSYTAKSGLKKYYKSNEKYDGNFGKNYVISPIGNNNEKRFYIMSLSDFKANNYSSFYWYKNASGNMNPLVTSNNFGQGKENTRKMIDKWNAAGTTSGYSNSIQDDRDIWKYVQIKYKEGWFIPSRGESAAFSNELSISSNEKRDLYKLSSTYWTSSQKDSIRAWSPYYYGSYYNMEDYGVKSYTFRVRLATTF